MQGLFLRGRGSQAHSQNNGSTVGVTSTTHQSGALGQIQGDAVRNIEGSLNHVALVGTNMSDILHTGAIDRGPLLAYHTASRTGSAISGIFWFTFNGSRVVPTASENRPANMAVRFLVKAAK